MNLPALALSIALVGWAAVMRAFTGTWLQPAAFFPLWWSFAGIAPLVLAPNEPVGANAMLWLLVASMSISAGAIVGNWGLKTRIPFDFPDAPRGERRLLGVALAIALLLGVFSSVTFVAAFSIPPADILSIERLVLVSNQLYLQRYAEGAAAAPPGLSQALLPFVFFAPAIGGVLFVLTRRFRTKVYALSSLLPAVAVTALQTTKAATLFAMVLWFSSYFATRLRMGRLAVFTRTHLVAAAIVGGIVTSFFFAVGLARLASTDVSLLNVVVLKIVNSAFGHMTVFSQWLAEYAQSDFSPSLGEITFAGPLELLGFGQRIPGLFDTLVDLVGGDTSNIYTGFRPLIQDFGLPGALVVLALIGLVGGVGFRMVAEGKWSAVPLLLVAYVTILWSPITWFWIYNSLTVAVLALGLVILAIRIWRGTVGGQSLTGTTHIVDSYPIR